MDDSTKPNHNIDEFPEDQITNLRKLTEPREVAKLFELDYQVLVYHIYKVPDEKKYRVFQIKKRHYTASKRSISAPNDSLKLIQSKLATLLTQIYVPKAPVHGFCKGRSILTNAKQHIKQKYVLNLDLKNFFPSINFGRVRGMFIDTPYNLDEKVATIFAQICCFKNELPQGAPTSPIISNMICAKMDTQLRVLAKENRCTYSRYADDITLSTSAPKLPRSIASIVSDESGNILQLGERLKSIIETNGFTINQDKVRLQTKTHRQEVTGIVTNQFPNVSRHYIRQVRAMLHAWEKYGIEGAEKEHLEKYRRQDRSPYKSASKYHQLSFKNILLGKIGFIGSIRGKTDFLYIKLLNKLISLSPDLIKQREKVTASFGTVESSMLRVITEGPTDWMHIKAALNYLKKSGKYLDLSFELWEYTEDMGEAKLLSHCKALAAVPLPGKTIQAFIFDRDSSKIFNEVNDGKNFKKWSNEVFSFSIPTPHHRASTPNVSIEFYYTDDEIKRLDSNNRRLFINNEFSRVSHRHKTQNLVCTDRNKIEKADICIIDNCVYDPKDNDVALPKKKYAQYVLYSNPNFDNFNFMNFGLIFDVILKILQEHQKS